MAIYKNREVTVIGPMPMASTVESITVSYQDGTHESVRLDQVKFTDQEKKDLVKAFPSKYDNVNTISDEDLKAVRLGIAPPSDPERKEQADAQVRQERMVEENQKLVDQAKSDAEKDFDNKLNTSDKVKK